jgi:amidase
VPESRLNMAVPPNYKEIAASARERRDGAIPSRYLLPLKALEDLPRNLTGIPRESGHFSEKELEIMDAEATDILRNIREWKWSAFDVTDTFCKAAIVAHQLVGVVPSCSHTVILISLVSFRPTA